MPRQPTGVEKGDSAQRNPGATAPAVASSVAHPVASDRATVAYPAGESFRAAETPGDRAAVAYPRIPYGEADFRGIRLDGALYVDKTRFLRRLEETRYAVLIRPRRFGKTCWVSLLETYYDRCWASEFDAVFAGTDIGREPTAERHRFVVLRFNFSVFNDALATLEQRFETYCRTEIRGALIRHPDLFRDDAVRRILAPPSVDGCLNELFAHIRLRRIPLYVMVDEYDNFANSVLAHHGEEAYRSFTHGGGFYRSFFATLKGGTERGGGGIERLFITGVSPITLDDVTSGFNIGRNLSLDPAFNEALGFTEEEVRGLLKDYRDRGVFDQDIDESLALMRDWYDGYRFARRATTTVYNTDMVLHYLLGSIPNLPGPEELIDRNVRIDYGKLRHLLVVGEELNGNFDLLRDVAVAERVECELQSGFPLERLAERENFLSLLHYFGLLSIRSAEYGETVLGIPNQTVRQLMYGYLRAAYEETGVCKVDLVEFGRRMRRMATDGQWAPVFEQLRDAVRDRTGNRDLAEGEKVVQTLLAAYLGGTNFYAFRSEPELAHGYADMLLEPMTVRYPRLRHGYVVELKYFKRDEGRTEARQDAAVAKATAQLRRYLADKRLAQQHPAVEYTGLAVVFRGWEMIRCEAVTPP